MAKEPKSPEQEIADGRRLEQLLEDPAVQEELKALDQRYWNEAKASNSEAEIIAAVAKARALDDLGTRLQAVVHNGKLATANRDRAPRK